MKILVQDSEGVRALEEGFASEEELQTFLKEHPDLMPLEEVDLTAPPLLCIGWEVGLVSGAEDILYVDPSGLLTVVETKLRKNPEARREVVGQILEYAAQMSTWSAADVERQAEKFFASRECAAQYAGSTLEKALQLFVESTGASPEFSYDDFLQQVQTNIERGHLRLVIAIDEPPEPLLRTVEFVNRFSERFEMYLIQLKQFRDGAKQQNIFVPALFGRVASTETKRRLPGRPWDKERFLQQASEKSRQSLPVLERLIQLAEDEAAIAWGRGPSVASFGCAFTAPDGKRVPAYWVMANGKMQFIFWTLNKRLNLQAIRAYRDALGGVKGMPREAIETDTWRDVDVTVLRSETSWEAFRQAVEALKRAIENSADDR